MRASPTWSSLPSLPQLARELRSGKRSALALTEQCLARQADLERVTRAYKTPSPALALELAMAADAAFAGGHDRGLLQGIPISVKDLFAVSGLATYAGTATRLGGPWEVDGALVAALRAQLAPLVGKTHTVEIAFGGLGTNPHWGTPRNPWSRDGHRVPGGSSAGAGISVVEGSALIALGTDTAGSVRIPASMSGCVGLKTTAGHWPMQGIFPLSSSFDSVGLLARSAVDAAFAFAALERALGREVQVPERRALAGLRIGVPEQFFWHGCSAGVGTAVHEALHELEAGGAHLVPLDLDDADEVFECFRQGGLTAAECYSFIDENFPRLFDALDPSVAERVRDGATLSAADYLRRKARLRTLALRAATSLLDVDVLAAPTVPITPPTVAELRNLETYRRANRMALRNTSVVSLLGLSALSMPVGLDACGLPVGMQLVARADCEVALLGAAQACERRLGCASERLGAPPLLAAPDSALEMHPA